MRRILFSGDGSGGDLIPLVLMAREFKRAGYDVCVCGSSEHSRIASDFGVPFEGYPHNYSEIYLENQRLGYIHNIRENIRHQEMLFQGEFDVLSKIAPDYDVLINFLAEIFVPSIAEAYGLPNIKLYTFPMVRSDRHGPPTGLPIVTENKHLNRLQWWAVVFAARHLFSYNDTVNRLRAQLNLPPAGDLLTDNANCDHMMIGLYEELMPPCPTWNRIDHTYIGPCIPSDDARLSDELEAFLGRGSQPIYVGFGSMRHANADELTRTILTAVRDVGVRVVLAQASSKIGSGLEGRDDVYLLKEYPIPHHILFPRLKAAVHHGSWITTHLAARAGIPQLVLPQASDQYQWADRISTAGLGPKGVDMNRMRPHKLSAAIAQLVQREDYAVNANALGDRVRGIDGPKNAVALFERIKGGLEAGKPVRVALP
ncbi:MAG: glycosyltransferase family 1 protein [Deltaproteobacteria bacterium]|nr:glycosyltransferase family 1 protein [Deltaproteobacteria bacterium]